MLKTYLIRPLQVKTVNVCSDMDSGWLYPDSQNLMVKKITQLISKHVLNIKKKIYF